MKDNEIVLTESGLLTFLSEIDELKDYPLSLTSDEDGIIVEIGDSIYKLELTPDSEVTIDSDAVEEIQEINECGFDDIDGLVDNDEEPIEGGVIKELLKTLAVGGLVRLTKNAIVKS